MPLHEAVARHLDALGVKYVVFRHEPVHTAAAAAQASHVPGREFAKVVVLRVEGDAYAMFVLPASEHLDLATVRRVSGHHAIAFATRDEIARRFPGCDPDAVPPFGRLFGVECVLDQCFFEHEEDEADGEIAFAAGTPEETVVMSFADYRRAAGPFTHEAHLHARPKPR